MDAPHGKSRRTALFRTAREAAVALAELKEQWPDRVDDPIKLLDFSSPVRLPHIVKRTGIESIGSKASGRKHREEERRSRKGKARDRASSAPPPVSSNPI